VLTRQLFDQRGHMMLQPFMLARDIGTTGQTY